MEITIQEAIKILFGSGFVGLVLKEYLQRSFDSKLSSQKDEFQKQVKSIEHQNQLDQLRTSLFFDHQRDAFAEIIKRLSDLIHKIDPIDSKEPQTKKPHYEEFCKVVDSHRLFLDEDCLTAIDLIQDWIFIYDGGDEPIELHNPFNAYYFLWYLNKQLSGIFRSKIGVEDKLSYLENVALIGAIFLFNRYHINKLSENLKITSGTQIESVAIAAREHKEFLVKSLQEFIMQSGNTKSIQKELRYATRYLNILEI